MPQKISNPQPPTGFKRILFRLPIWLYKAHLGWLLGKRFLLLNHIGRKSGLPRQVVLEVVRFDQETSTYIIASGFGETSQWYQNLLQQPQVTIQIGSKNYQMAAKFLSTREGAAEMVNYAQRHPSAAKNLPQLMGYRVDGTEEDYAEFGKLIPFVALQPVEQP